VQLDDFLDPDELETWRHALDHATGARASRLPDRSDGDTSEYFNNVFTQRVNLWKSDERIAKLMLDERLGELASELAGVDAIRIWHDQALIKEPWGNATAWHLDNPKWSFYTPHALSLWVALDDVTMQNGCLYFLPGTHKEARYETPLTAGNIRDIFKAYPQWETMEPVAAEMKAGSCTFHNGLIAHGAGPNMTPRRRRAMTCGYMPDGSTFNGQQNILSDEQMAALQVGDVLADDRQNPLIYSRKP
jgi:ectoine hydroxylase-related dioxygenase (phytanoyl-CoA dioxygenase family)